MTEIKRTEGESGHTKGDHCWCALCGARFSEAETVGAQACPKCGHKGIPCDAKQDLSVVVNWHELRILGIWAENWAQRHCGDDPQMTPVVHAITRRLQRQYPDLTPLTLSGEVAQIKDRGYGIESYNIAKSNVIPVNGPGAIPDPSCPGNINRRKLEAGEEVTRQRDILLEHMEAIYSAMDEEIKARFHIHPGKSEEQAGGKSKLYHLLVVPRNIARSALAQAKAAGGGQ